MHKLLDMVMVGSHADDRYEAVARFLAAFNAHQARAASEFFTSDAEVIELERDHAGRMVSARTNARGRHSITAWLEDFVAANVRIRPAGHWWDRDALVVDASWTLVGPSGDTLTGTSRGRYIFDNNLVSRLTVSTLGTA